MLQWRVRCVLVFILVFGALLSACSTPRAKKVCAVLDTGGENDKNFNQFTLEGARKAALEAGLPFDHIVTSSDEDYLPYINNFIDDGCGLIITVGFLMRDATAIAAIDNPDVRFAIIDAEYFPGDVFVPGQYFCPETIESCYSEEGGLANVTGLVFAEDQVGYLAGTLAGCMTETGIIGSVAGMEIPPVVRFVAGYQSGARAFRPDIETLSYYAPAFNDAYTGKQEGDKQVAAGADVIFGVGGNTGNGGLLAANDAGLMTIGVDVDQYDIFPEVRPSLITSAAKKMNIAAAEAVQAYAAGTLEGGTQRSTVANGGVGLAPYHDWENKISGECKLAVAQATEDLANGTIEVEMPK
ncbi:MAG TPA: BMP family ABC transporter substrate-binding protein [Anaerolineae bacterium]|nr:BMP family ABC transporter substrate-binding protein [Anaerolineae bacterium]